MTRDQADAMTAVLHEVAEERQRQHAKWGEQNLPDGTAASAMTRFLAEQYRERCKRAEQNGSLTFEHVLREEVFEAFAESDPEKLRAELLQVVAVGVQWIEAIDRRRSRAL